MSKWNNYLTIFFSIKKQCKAVLRYVSGDDTAFFKIFLDNEIKIMIRSGRTNENVARQRNR